MNIQESIALQRIAAGWPELIPAGVPVARVLSLALAAQAEESELAIEAASDAAQCEASAEHARRILELEDKLNAAYIAADKLVQALRKADPTQRHSGTAGALAAWESL